MKSSSARLWSKKILRCVLPVLAFFLFGDALLPMTGPLPNWVLYLFFGGLTVILCEVSQIGRTELRLCGPRPMGEIGAGLLLGASGVGLLLAVFLLLYGSPQYFLAAGAESIAQLLQNCLLYLLLVAPVEELLFRGYLLYCLEDLTGSSSTAVFLQAVMFGLWHWPGGHSVVQVLSMTCLGLLYGWYVQNGRRGSVLTVIAAHGLHNLVLELIRWFFC